LTWANRFDLARVRGIGPKYANLLEQAGVDTIPELAQRNPENLSAKLAEVNATAGVVKMLPYPGHVASWVSQAKELPRLITY
jgi:predicted flap endonuclease-1-like 5' DNA nuclease